MSDYIKFGENAREVIKLTSDEPVISDNNFGGKQYTYNIEETITGETKFSATEKLHEKIKILGVGTGDTLYIEKVKKEGVNNGFAFFKVELPEVPVKKVENAPPTMPDNSGMGAGFVDKDAKDFKLRLHELEIRVESLEKK